MKKFTTIALMLIAIVFHNCGCAVLTVDVDVYKGPLTNHPDVQVQEAAVMALAAKPLLGKLRYTLESRADTTYLPTALEHNNDWVPVADPLAYGRPRELDACIHIPQTTEQIHREGYRFRDPDAEFVNRILAEYDSSAEVKKRYDWKQYKNNASDPNDSAQSPDLWKLSYWQNVQREKARGRGNEGLEFLIDEYLAAVKRQRDNKEDVNPAANFPQRDHLFDALVHFSQKILFVANYNVLFPNADTSEAVPADSATNIRVLQAIGNSLLVQLDELRQEEAHRRSLSDAAPREAAALESVETAGPYEVLTTFVHDVNVQAAKYQDAIKKDGAAYRDADRALTAANNKKDSAVQSKSAADWGVAITEVMQGLIHFAQKNVLLTADIRITLRDVFAKFRADAVETQEKAKEVLKTATSLVEQASNDLDVANKSLQDHKDQATAYSTTAKMLPKAALNVLNNLDLTDSPPSPVVTRDRLLRELKTLRDEPEATKPAPAATTRVTTPTTTTSAKTTQVTVTLAANISIARPTDSPAPATEPATSYKTDSAAKEESDAYTVAIEVIKKMSLPAARLAGAVKPHASTDVLEGLISSLNYQYIEEVKRSGKGSTTSQYYVDALEAAYNRRADMAYIRPASSYLRSSFPSSSLQKDARIGWKNMLGEHGLRQIPLADVFANGDPQAYRTVLELDKQNWQNINTIRVAGGGNTNYVVAKDDIGNWYVKNYSADPEPIIKSAQGLALFAMGPGLKGAPALLDALAKKRKEAAKPEETPASALTNLGTNGANSGATSGATDGAAKSATDTTPSTNPLIDTSGQSTSVLGVELKDAGESYDTQTTTDLTTVKQDATGLRGGVVAAWTSDQGLKDYQSELTATLDAKGGPVETLQAAIALADKADPKKVAPGETIIDVLQAMKRFHGDLSVAIIQKLLDARTKTLGDDKAAQAKADADNTAAIKSRDDAKAKRDAAKSTADSTQLSFNQASQNVKTEQSKKGGGDPVTLAPLQTQLDLATTANKNASGALVTAENDLSSKQASADSAKQTLDSANAVLKKAQDDRDAAAKAADQANKDMTAAIKSKIQPTLQKRQQAVKSFNVAIDLITKATGK